jgi:hypothetical protein
MLDGPGDMGPGAYGPRLDSGKRYMGRVSNQGFLIDGPMSDSSILKSLWVNCPPDIEADYEKFCNSEKCTPKYKRKRRVALHATLDFCGELKGEPMGFIAVYPIPFAANTLFFPFKFEQEEPK